MQRFKSTNAVVNNRPRDLQFLSGYHSWITMCARSRSSAHLLSHISGFHSSARLGSGQNLECVSNHDEADLTELQAQLGKRVSDICPPPIKNRHAGPAVWYLKRSTPAVRSRPRAPNSMTPLSRSPDGCDVQYGELSLPLELVEFIIDLGEQRERRTWSLVCKWTSHRARSHMFYRLRISGARKCERFLVLGDGASAIGQHVRRLELYNSPPWKMWAIQSLSTFLKVMPHLTTLSFIGQHANPLQQVPRHVLDSFRSHENLQHVVLHHYAFHPINCFHDILASTPRLSSLSIEGSKGSLTDPSLIRPTLNIKKLTMGRSGLDPKSIYYWLIAALIPQSLQEISFDLVGRAEHADLPLLKQLAYSHSTSIRRLRVGFVFDCDLCQLIPTLRQLLALRELQIDTEPRLYQGAAVWLEHALQFVEESGLSDVELRLEPLMQSDGILHASIAAAAQLNALLSYEHLSVRMVVTTIALDFRSLETIFRDAGVRLMQPCEASSALPGLFIGKAAMYSTAHASVALQLVTPLLDCTSGGSRRKVIHYIDILRATDARSCRS